MIRQFVRISNTYTGEIKQRDISGIDAGQEWSASETEIAGLILPDIVNAIFQRATFRIEFGAREHPDDDTTTADHIAEILLARGMTDDELREHTADEIAELVKGR